MISIYVGNAMDKLKELKSNSVDNVVTSPPYYGLRSYDGADTIWGGDQDCEHEWETGIRKGITGGLNSSRLKSTKTNESSQKFQIVKSSLYSFCSKCGAWKGQLGMEPTYKMYVNHIVEIMHEVKRVLKPTGTLFLNLGDSYAGNMGKRSGYGDRKMGFDSNDEAVESGTAMFFKPDYENIKRKSLMLIPERIAIGMIDDGWILRNKYIWYKRNAMPTSAQDRFGGKWEIVYFCVKSEKYYFDLDSIRKSFSSKPIERNSDSIEQLTLKNYEIAGDDNSENYNQYNNKMINENGANPGDVSLNPYDDILSDPVVFESYLEFLEDKYPEILSDSVLDVPTRPHKFKHFAIYPETLIEPLIKAGCAKEVCSQCGKPKIPVKVKTGRIYDGTTGQCINEEKLSSRKIAEANNTSQSSVFRTNSIEERITKWKASCNCNAPFIAGTVLDPFAGSGTTLTVAQKLKLNGIGIEISEKYAEIIKERLGMNNKVEEYKSGTIDDLLTDLRSD